MIKRILRLILVYGAFLTIISFATVQFFLILRHKSPYLSDSYFYKHIFYQMKGNSPEIARRKIVSQVDLANADEITKNIFTNEKAYQNSYQFFIKRPFYPFIVWLLSFLTSKEYLLFLVPIFSAYAGSIILSFRLFTYNLEYFFAIFALALFVSFYPFLDWSTYFLTDTIGFFFWLGQVVVIYRYTSSENNRLLLFYGLLLLLSLFNREQSLLMVPLTLFLLMLMKFFGAPRKQLVASFRLVIVSLIIAFFFLLFTKIFGFVGIWETIVYTQNSYGLYSNQYTFVQTLQYLFETIKKSHLVFAREIVSHHWWFTFTALGILGIAKMTLLSKEKKLIDLIILCSGIASYLSIFIYPVLSYRFFFPTVIMIAYFAAKFIQNFFEKRQSLKL